ALVFGWSGFFITHAHDGHLIHARAYALIPLALLTQNPLLVRFQFQWFFFLSLTLALMFYAGHTQLPLYVFYLLLGRALWWGIVHWIRVREWKQGVQPFLATLAAQLFSMGLAALVLLPLLQLSLHTAERAGGADYEFATSDSMPP